MALKPLATLFHKPPPQGRAQRSRPNGFREPRLNHRIRTALAEDAMTTTTTTTVPPYYPGITFPQGSGSSVISATNIWNGFNPYVSQPYIQTPYGSGSISVGYEQATPAVAEPTCEAQRQAFMNALDCLDVLGEEIANYAATGTRVREQFAFYEVLILRSNKITRDDWTYEQAQRTALLRSLDTAFVLTGMRPAPVLDAFGRYERSVLRADDAALRGLRGEQHADVELVRSSLAYCLTGQAVYGSGSLLSPSITVSPAVAVLVEGRYTNGTVVAQTSTRDHARYTTIFSLKVLYTRRDNTQVLQDFSVAVEDLEFNTTANVTYAYI